MNVNIHHILVTCMIPSLHAVVTLPCEIIHVNHHIVFSRKLQKVVGIKNHESNFVRIISLQKYFENNLITL